MPADHPLAASEHVTWPELRPWPLIVSGTSSGNRRMLDAALRDIDWRPDRLIEIEHLTTSLGIVEAGLGISIIPRCAALRSRRSPAIFVSRCAGWCHSIRRSCTNLAERIDARRVAPKTASRCGRSLGVVQPVRDKQRGHTAQEENRADYQKAEAD
jgi:DNA-binding transcriptional LysR family regulator